MSNSPQSSNNYLKELKKTLDDQSRPSSTNNKAKVQNIQSQTKNYNPSRPRLPEGLFLVKDRSCSSLFNQMHLNFKQDTEQKLSKPSIHSYRSNNIEPNPEKQRCMTTYNSPSNKTLKDECNSQVLNQKWKKMKDEKVHDVYSRTEQKPTHKNFPYDFEEESNYMDRVKTETTQKIGAMKIQNKAKINQKAQEQSSIQSANFKKTDKYQLVFSSQRNSINSTDPISKARAQIQQKQEKKPFNKELQQEMEIKLLSSYEYMIKCDNQIKELKEEFSNKEKEIASQLIKSKQELLKRDRELANLKKKIQDTNARNQTLQARNQTLRHQLMEKEQKVNKVIQQNEQLQKKISLDQNYYERPLKQTIQKLQNEISSKNYEIKRNQCQIDKKIVSIREFQEKQLILRNNIKILQQQLQSLKDSFSKQTQILKAKLQKPKSIRLVDLDKEIILLLRKEVEQDFNNQMEESHRTQKDNEELKKNIQILQQQLQSLKDSFSKQTQILKAKLQKPKSIRLVDLDKEIIQILRKEVEEDLKNEVQYFHQKIKENEELKEKLRLKEQEIVQTKAMQRGKTKGKK